jgi:exodeoxyribonuclease VII large subunit
VGRVALLRSELTRIAGRLKPAAQRQIEGARSRLAVAASALNALSPLATLQRGYAIVTLGTKVVTDAQTLKAGERLALRFARGSAEATVDVTRPDDASD